MPNISIQNRMLLTVVVGLFTLLLTHLVLLVVLSQMVHYQKENQLSDYALAFAGSASFDGEHLIFTLPPPDARFMDQASGLGAAIFINQRLMWLSPSAKTFPPLPFSLKDEKELDIRQSVFSPGIEKHSWHRLFTPMILQDGTKMDIFIFEDASSSVLQIEAFKEAMFAALLCAFILILAAQTVAARWSTRPLFRMTQELKQIRLGKQSSFEGVYPPELHEVGQSINELITHESEQTQTYQNSLSNLAHSLKTPLAVLRQSLENPDDDELRAGLLKQITKIDKMVSYQLSMASRSGHQTFTKPVLLESMALEIAEALEKIHAQKGALCEFEIEEGVFARANSGDMQELLGNLLENAFKWCDQRVLLSINQQQDELIIQVDDDGQGVPPEKVSVIMERGTRADEHVQGHGIGLAIVSDIVRTYQGTLHVGKSEELGGASFKVVLPMKQEVAQAVKTKKKKVSNK